MINKTLNGTWLFKEDSQDTLSFNDVVSFLNKNNGLKEIKVPSNWQLQGLNNYNGSVWFIKKINLNDAEYEKKLKTLVFEGVDYFCDIWINGTYVGSHEGYFQKFWFNVSGLLTIDTNTIVVKVSSPLEPPKKVWPLKKKLIKGIFNHHDCRPGGWSYEHGQDKNTGGIWNNVSLTFTEFCFIEDVKADTKINFKENRASVLLKINYCSNFETAVNDEIKIKLITPEKDEILIRKKVHLKPGSSQVYINFEINEPMFWWSWDTGEQNLYKVFIYAKHIDEYEQVFGIREVKLNDSKIFFLNGKRLFLRGTNIIPSQFLSDLNASKIKKQVSLIKEANMNIVRVHAHVNRKEFYEECDRQGVLVWQDFALQWTYDESPQFIENAVSQIKDMVRQNYNHPSIGFWCCHNEPGEQIKTLDPFLYDAVLSEDNSRIVRLASNYEEHAYDGWYWGNKEHYAAAPMGPLVTEFGAQGLPNVNSLKKIFKGKKLFPPEWNNWKYHNFQYEQTFHIAGIKKGKSIGEFVKNSQNYQAELIKTAIDFYRRKRFKGINAVFQFMLIDCWESITWSVVDYYFKKKKAYFTLKEVFQPVYVSVNLRQSKYFTGQKLNIDLWIINDLHKEFENCKVLFYIDKRKFYSLLVGKILSDSVDFKSFESLNIPLPDNVQLGKHKIILKLFTGKKTISENNFEISFEKKEII